MVDTLLAGADANVVDGEGEPIAWPVALAGDKGYRADWIDAYLLALGIEPVIPSKANENRDSRRVAFDREAYRDRNIVERLIGWLKESRRIFSRFEKTAKNFGGMIKMAFIHRYLRLATEESFRTKPSIRMDRRITLIRCRKLRTPVSNYLGFHRRGSRRSPGCRTAL